MYQQRLFLKVICPLLLLLALAIFFLAPEGFAASFGEFKLSFALEVIREPGWVDPSAPPAKLLSAMSAKAYAQWVWERRLEYAALTFGVLLGMTLVTAYWVFFGGGPYTGEGGWGPGGPPKNYNNDGIEEWGPRSNYRFQATDEDPLETVVALDELASALLDFSPPGPTVVLPLLLWLLLLLGKTYR